MMDGSASDASSIVPTREARQQGLNMAAEETLPAGRHVRSDRSYRSDRSDRFRRGGRCGSSGVPDRRVACFGVGTHLCRSAAVRQRWDQTDRSDPTDSGAALDPPKERQGKEAKSCAVSEKMRGDCNIL